MNRTASDTDAPLGQNGRGVLRGHERDFLALALQQRTEKSSNATNPNYRHAQGSGLALHHVSSGWCARSSISDVLFP